MAKSSQDLENLAFVVSRALGGGKEEAASKPEAVQSFGELAKKFGALGGLVG